MVDMIWRRPRKVYITFGEIMLRLKLPNIERFFQGSLLEATFAGKDYQDIYITSAGGGKRPEEGEKAGALFRLNTRIQDIPEHLSRICFYYFSII